MKIKKKNVSPRPLSKKKIVIKGRIQFSCFLLRHIGYDIGAYSLISDNAQHYLICGYIHIRIKKIKFITDILYNWTTPGHIKFFHCQ